MIRHYESLGPMPKVARTLGDYRVYTAADLHTLRFIKRARGLGLSMKEIRTFGARAFQRAVAGEYVLICAVLVVTAVMMTFFSPSQ